MRSTSKIKNKLASVVLGCVLLVGMLTLAGCGSGAPADQGAADKTTVKIGCSFIEKDMIEAVKADFEAKGYTLEVSVFDDMVTPNVALSEGSIDVNYYQFLPYLETYNAEKGADLVAASAPIYICPVGVFSNKITDLAALPDGAKVAINNDTTNRARALEVLQELKLIKLNPDVENPTKNDIVENPKNLEILEMDDASLPQVLADVDLSLMYSLTAAFSDLKISDALATGGIADKYGIIMAVRSADKDAQWIKDLTDSFTGQSAKDFLNSYYDGACQPMF